MAVINYKNVLDEIQDVLQAWNDTTAAYDLSTNLTTRVQRISQRNPAMISGQPSKFPSICIRLNRDDKNFSEISANGIQGKKVSELGFSIIGILYYNSFSDTNTDNDDYSDMEVHYLAENVEEVLRRNARLSNKVLYSYPTSVNFYDDLDEEAYFRTFVMDYKAKLFY